MHVHPYRTFGMYSSCLHAYSFDIVTIQMGAGNIADTVRYTYQSEKKNIYIYQ